MHNEDPKQAVVNLEESAEPLIRWMTDLKVDSPESQKNAEDLLISARAAHREAEEKRKELTRPLDEAKRRIMALFAPYLERLETGIGILNRELTGYRNALLELQREEERRALEEQAERLRRARETGEVVDPVEAPAAMPHVAKTSRANLGSVTYRDEWDIKVVDPAAVPRDLCEPSMPRIRARVKSGVTEIPGVLVSRRTVSTARKGGF